jgi:DNA-binding NarL/FixJ family response regulator
MAQIPAGLPVDRVLSVVEVQPAAGISVVLADDDARFRRLVRSVLEDDGYVVLAEAHDAPSARALTAAHRPDVLVLDLVMPGATGLSALREILDDDPGQPVLVISSLFDPSVEQQVVRLGAWYLEKAEGLDALEHAIDGAASVTAHLR